MKSKSAMLPSHLRAGLVQLDHQRIRTGFALGCRRRSSVFPLPKASRAARDSRWFWPVVKRFVGSLGWFQRNSEASGRRGRLRYPSLLRFLTHRPFNRSGSHKQMRVYRYLGLNAELVQSRCDLGVQSRLLLGCSIACVQLGSQL
jgi:hypothetical protein